MIIAIDASRNRSGGAIAHLIGILNHADPSKFGITKIHVWTYKKLTLDLPQRSWLQIHTPSVLEKGILHQIFWQRFSFTKELKLNKSDILLNTDAGTFGTFRPCVTMSRDMLSYEPKEMSRYSKFTSLMRLWLLRYIQNISFRRADGVIFLTNYASDIIQKDCGRLKNYTIIPHGVHEMFRGIANIDRDLNASNGQVIKCIYVSNVLPYKHQWHVIRAISILKKRGYNLELHLVGVGDGPYQSFIDKEIKLSDPDNLIIRQYPFVNNRELLPHLQNSDIFIFASSCENMPVTLVEAMAAGLPVACSNRGPMPEVLKDGGLYFDPENPIEIANKVEEIITNDELRYSLRNKSFSIANDYSWSRCANETLGFLSNICKGIKDL
jgi:glycosyltransferase involved in cell wall biosynthesis